MKRFRTFVLADVIVWGSVNLIALVPIAWAIAYNWRRGLPVGAWVALVATALGFVGITAYRFFRRWQWVSHIRWYTRHGVAVSFGSDGAWFKECVERAGGGFHLRRTIEEAIEAAVMAWPRSGPSFNGVLLVILPQVWARGIRYMGFATGDAMAVAWDEDRNPGLDGLRSIISHESAHIALTALGVPPTDEAQHPAIEAHGF